MGAQSTEPHQPGRRSWLLKGIGRREQIAQFPNAHFEAFHRELEGTPHQILIHGCGRKVEDLGILKASFTQESQVFGLERVIS